MMAHTTAMPPASRKAGMKEPVACTTAPAMKGASVPPAEPPTFGTASSVAPAVLGATTAASAQPQLDAILAPNNPADMNAMASPVLPASAPATVQIAAASNPQMMGMRHAAPASTPRR